jgi:hypothetical protein
MVAAVLAQRLGPSGTALFGIAVRDQVDIFPLPTV